MHRSINDYTIHKKDIRINNKYTIYTHELNKYTTQTHKHIYIFYLLAVIVVINFIEKITNM